MHKRLLLILLFLPCLAFAQQTVIRSPVQGPPYDGVNSQFEVHPSPGQTGNEFEWYDKNGNLISWCDADGVCHFSGGPSGVNWYLDNVLVGAQPGGNIIEGSGVTVTAANDPTNHRVNYTFNATGSGGCAPGGTLYSIIVNDPLGTCGGFDDFTWEDGNVLIAGDVPGGVVPGYTYDLGLGNSWGTGSTWTVGLYNDSSLANHTFVAGEENIAKSSYDYITGVQNETDGIEDFTEGWGNELAGNFDFAFGHTNNIQGDYSGAFGSNLELASTGGTQWGYGYCFTMSDPNSVGLGWHPLSSNCLDPPQLAYDSLNSAWVSSVDVVSPGAVRRYRHSGGCELFRPILRYAKSQRDR